MYVNYEYTLTYIRKIESCVMSQMYYVYVVIRILNSAYPNTHTYKCIESFDQIASGQHTCVYVFVCVLMYVCMYMTSAFSVVCQSDSPMEWFMHHFACVA